MSRIHVNLKVPVFFEESIVINFESSKEFKSLPSYVQKMFTDTGCVPAHVADKLFPLFTPGYYGRLAARGKITGYRIGSSYFVNLRQAWEYTRPKLIDPNSPPCPDKEMKNEAVDLKDIGI